MKPRAPRSVIGLAGLRGVVLVVTVVVLAAAAVVGWRALDLRNDPALDNLAMIDQKTQEQVVAEVSRGLVAVLSYDYSEPEATRAMADKVLRGQARQEYDTLFKSLQERAPGQKLLLSAQVRLTGVQELSADRAKLLVFLDQSSTRAKDKQASVSAAQLSVTAKRKSGTWTIVGLQPL